MNDNQMIGVSTELIERYNKVLDELRKRPDLNDERGALEKAMNAFMIATNHAEAALNRAEGTLRC